MKRFLIKLSFFSLSLIIPILLVVLGELIIKNCEKFWKIPDDKDCIVLGHSHPECAFNDSLIQNLINLSLSGEAYLYTYTKLKKLIESNKQLKTVFIEFGTNNFHESMDLWTWDNEHLNYNLPKYFAIIDKTEIRLLRNNNSKLFFSVTPRNYIKEIGYSYYNLLFNGNRVISNKRRYGGYLYLIRNKIDSLVNIDQEIITNKNSNDIPIKTSNTNILYLNKILELCKQNKITAYLIRTPVHKMYSNQQEEEIYKCILNNEFSNSTFLDFKAFPLTDDEFGDFGHLNYKGAEIFSRWFSKLLSKGLLLTEEKQKFIDEEILQFSMTRNE